MPLGAELRRLLGRRVPPWCSSTRRSELAAEPREGKDTRAGRW